MELVLLDLVPIVRACENVFDKDDNDDVML
jgi:hypothetical protein